MYGVIDSTFGGGGGGGDGSLPSNGILSGTGMTFQ